MKWESEDLKKPLTPEARGARGAVRRMAIRATKRVLWQLEGHKRPTGETEPAEAEVFSGVGFYSRPRTSSRAEAILSAIGDAAHSVIVATRDEDLRRLWKSALDAAADVAAVFNSLAIVLVKGGTIEIRSRTGELLVEPTIKGTTYRNAEDTLLTAMAAAFAEIATNFGTLSVPAVASGAMAGAFATFSAAAATYVTTVLKAE